MAQNRLRSNWNNQWFVRITDLAPTCGPSKKSAVCKRAVQNQGSEDRTGYPIRQSQQRSTSIDTLIARSNPRDPIFSLALPRHPLYFAAPPDPAVMDFRHVSWMSWHRTRGPSRSPKKPRPWHPLCQRLARFEVCSSLGVFLSLAFPELALPRFLGG